jgi:hypothetical protein
MIAVHKSKRPQRHRRNEGFRGQSSSWNQYQTNSVDTLVRSVVGQFGFPQQISSRKFIPAFLSGASRPQSECEIESKDPRNVSAAMR